MARLRILTLISIVLSVIVFFEKNRKPSTIVDGKGLLVDKAWLKENLHPLAQAKDIRSADQTFLTYPEWFLVFSPAEQADYFKNHTSTSFPYLKHVDQLWKGYGIVYDQIKSNYKFNTGYHVMIIVIAGSTAVEYGAKSFYETVIGRVTDTAPGAELTEEDNFNARYMNRYVKFIGALPWYEYDFNSELKSLWATTSFFGPHFLRKLERKYYLTTELLVKSGYGWLIKLGTRASYDEASLNTAVVMDGLPSNSEQFPEIKDIRRLADGSILADLPRYADFNPAISKLVLNGIKIKEIAGNNSAIMLTVITERSVDTNRNFKILFTQPFMTKPGLNRMAIVTTVDKLSDVIPYFNHHNIKIEHIFDY